MTKPNAPRPLTSNSQKFDWDTERRERFEAELLRLGWVKKTIRSEEFLGRRMPSEVRYCKDTPSLPAIYVDDFGVFLYEHGHRIAGISDEEIDASDPGYLCFNYGRKLDLRTGGWMT